MTANHGWNTICQTHGNVSDYTGGFYVLPDGTVAFRNEGGKKVSEKGHIFESHLLVTMGEWEFDTWHHIRLEADWQPVKGGYVRARLDGGSWIGKDDCPTAPSDATNQMLRFGLYPSGDLPGPLKLRVRSARVESPA